MMKSHSVPLSVASRNDPTQWESVSAIIHCKCRQCETCLKKRRQHWWFRAKHEMALAPRTWFATFTYSPECLFLRETEVRKRCRAKAIDYDALEPREQLSHLLDRTGEDLTLYFKKLRKSARAPVRYLLVSETGSENGRVHYHALIHEVRSGAVNYDLLRAKWSFGFTAFKLAEPKAVSYVAKYISKDARTRVRASESYGIGDAAYSLIPSRTEVVGEHRIGAQPREERNGSETQSLHDTVLSTTKSEAE